MNGLGGGYAHAHIPMCKPKQFQETRCARPSAVSAWFKNDGYSWGTLHRRPMEGLAFCYDRHEEITRYIRMRDMHYLSSNGNVCVLLTSKKFLAGFVITDAIQYNLTFNTFHKMCILISSP